MWAPLFYYTHLSWFWKERFLPSAICFSWWECMYLPWRFTLDLYFHRYRPLCKLFFLFRLSVCLKPVPSFLSPYAMSSHTTNQNIYYLQPRVVDGIFRISGHPILSVWCTRLVQVKAREGRGSTSTCCILMSEEQ